MGSCAKDVHRLGRLGLRLVTVHRPARFINEPPGRESSMIGEPERVGNDGERRAGSEYGET